MCCVGMFVERVSFIITLLPPSNEAVCLINLIIVNLSEAESLQSAMDTFMNLRLNCNLVMRHSFNNMYH